MICNSVPKITLRLVHQYGLSLSNNESDPTNRRWPKDITTFVSCDASSATVQKERLIFEVHLGILGEMSELTLHSNMELPRTAPLCAQLCSARLENVRENFPGSYSSPRMKAFEEILKKSIAEFAESVQLYRNVVMECATFRSLRYCRVGKLILF